MQISHESSKYTNDVKQTLGVIEDMPRDTVGVSQGLCPYLTLKP